MVCGLGLVRRYAIPIIPFSRAFAARSSPSYRMAYRLRHTRFPHSLRVPSRSSLAGAGAPSNPSRVDCRIAHIPASHTHTGPSGHTSVPELMTLEDLATEGLLLGLPLRGGRATALAVTAIRQAPNKRRRGQWQI